MAIISSHVLDSVIGDHARGIAVECVRVSDRTSLFSVFAGDDGRISENVDIHPNTEVELLFNTARYFAGRNPLPADGGQILNAVVVRLQLPDANRKYHLPVVLSPHSYTLWWSGVDPA